jgi:type I restriction enzyme M protein
MAIKKSELYASLWKGCDELRGGMDASQYKDYVLSLLFMKYVSDKYQNDPDGAIEIPPGGGFKDMVALKGQKYIGEGMDKVVGALAEANGLTGVIDIAHFNDDNLLGRGKEKVDRLSNLIAIFESPALDFSKNRAEGDDILGDAYEYLMRHFATQSGKSKGQFYTPAEVSRVMAKIVGIGDSKSQEETLYDPTCGSGSLLLKAADEAPHGITIYGQEMDVATTALAKMNMILHGQATADIAPGGNSTLATPKFLNNSGKLKTFDYVVANPPFSYKAWSTGLNPANDEYERFIDTGVPPQKNGDYAFLLHILKSLKSTGKGACILPHGVLFRGNAEGDIRQRLLKRGVIKGIIGLPANLFYGTGIPACIVVLDKAGATVERPVFVIDASKGFVKDGNKNRLRPQDIHRIVDVFNATRNEDRYSRLVLYSEIERNGFNLNLPRYIDSSEPEDLQDIDCHLNGGIPTRDVEALAPYWDAFPGLRESLFTDRDRPGVMTLRVEIGDIKSTVYDHPSFAAFRERVRDHFAAWRQRHRSRMLGLHEGDHPKHVIKELAEDLLTEFEPLPLVDAYDVYGHLMAYWEATMQDDAYLVALDGWKAAKTLREVAKDDKGKPTETPDLTLGKLKLKAEAIPPGLVIARFFPAEGANAEAMQASLEALAGEVAAMIEEQGGEDGLLASAMNDKEKVTSALAIARMKSLGRLFTPDDEEAEEERQALSAFVETSEKMNRVKTELTIAADSLTKKVIHKYEGLTDDEARELIVDDKWLATLATAVETELDRLSGALIRRVRTLGERYETPLPKLEDDVENFSEAVEAELRRMGFAWSS